MNPTYKHLIGGFTKNLNKKNHHVHVMVFSLAPLSQGAVESVFGSTEKLVLFMEENLYQEGCASVVNISMVNFEVKFF